MIEDDPRIDPAELRRVRFPGSMRKFDAKAVQDFLASVAERVEATNALVDRLQAERDAAQSQATEQQPAPSPFDRVDLASISEDELVRLVGEETVHVLSTARKAASDIRTKAEESAARVIRESTAEAADLVATAETDAAALSAEAAGARDAAVAEAEAEGARITENAAEEAERVIAEAREDAEALTAAAADLRREAAEEKDRIIEEAKDEGRAMLAEAKDVRTRILEDLQRRRDLGRSQVERLAAGRDQLLDAYAAVRANIDEITAKLEVGLIETASSGHDPLLDDGFAGIVISGIDDQDEVDDEQEAAEDDASAGDDDTAPSDEAGPEAENADEAAAEDGSEPDGSEPATDDEHPDVDALFAKIRADRAESVARAQQVLAGAEGDAATDEAGDQEAATATDATDEDELVDAASEETDDATGFEHVPAELLADEESRAARAAVLDRLDKALTRALKRHLADEQNVVLDALRRSESTDLADLLPPADAHIAGYAAVAAVELAAAAAAGAALVDDTVEVDVSALAAELGTALVEPFRRRIERSAAEVDGDADALDERLRALYREWKVEHIGGLASDSLLSAYARGQHAAAPAGAKLRWTIDPEQGPCPDAEDNALAGAVTKGEPFPTGDECPQAHPGCRCLLVVEAEPGA